jgi:ABC-type nitrate/sulfonate/bicarbonate transport system permease component
MIGRVTYIWAKPLGNWTLVDLVHAILLVSLVSVACGFALGIVAVIPAAVVGDRRKPTKTEAQFELR